jgi:hypothetical protein
MCKERSVNGKGKKIEKVYQKYFSDPFFLCQKEIAGAINLYELRE